MAVFESHNRGEFVKSFGNGYSATFVRTPHGVECLFVDSPQYRGDESPEQVIGKRRLGEGLREAKEYFRIPTKK